MNRELINIAGNAETHKLDERIVNLFCFIIACGSVIGVFINFAINLPAELNILLICLCFCFVFLFYLSRFKKKTSIVKPVFSFLLILILNATWFYNEGIYGSSAIMFILIYFIVLSIYAAKWILINTILMAANIILLVLIQKYYPSLIVPYPTKEAQFQDLFFGMLMAVLFSAIVIAMFIKSYEIERKKVEQQKIELEKAHTDITSKNKQITDSILYAKHIQSAVLPSTNILSGLLTEHFIVFKPRHIVSGDFYWIKKIKNLTILAVADCTGHGVPGAIMSMLGISFLNEIVSRVSIDNTGTILNNLRERIKQTLNQNDPDVNQKDGMDIVLISIDNNTLQMQFSGAYNPLYVIRSVLLQEQTLVNFTVNPQVVVTKSENAVLIEFKADRQPVAIHVVERNFTTQNFQLQKGDILYAGSDGYADQIGGKNQRKFMSRNLKKLLLDIYDKPLTEQSEILTENLDKWKTGFEQVDDVLIVGVKI